MNPISSYCIAFAFLFLYKPTTAQVNHSTPGFAIEQDETYTDASFDKNNFVFDANGNWVAVRYRKNNQYNVALYNLQTGIKTDSITTYDVGKIAATIEGDGFYVEENYPQTSIKVYQPAKGLSKPIYTWTIPLTEAGINYQITSALVSVQQKKIIAVLYDIATSGAASEMELIAGGWGDSAKQFNYQLWQASLEDGKVLYKNNFKATEAKLAGNVKNTLLICANKGTNYRYELSVFNVENGGALKPVTAINKLHIADKVLFTDAAIINNENWWFRTSEQLYRYNQTSDMLLVVNEKNIHSMHEGVLFKGSTAIVSNKADRWQQHFIALYDTSGRQLKIDTRSFLAQHIISTTDHITGIMINNGSLVFQTFARPTSSAVDRDFIFQQSLPIDKQLSLPGTPYIVQYNSEGWQVVNTASQIIVHKEPLDFGTRQFAAMPGTDKFIMLSDNQPKIYTVGQWKEKERSLEVNHPLLNAGDGLYKSTTTYCGVFYQPDNKTIIGLVKKQQSYFVLVYDPSDNYNTISAFEIPFSQLSIEPSYFGNFTVTEAAILIIAGSLQKNRWSEFSRNPGELAKLLSLQLKKIPKQFLSLEASDYNIETRTILSGALLLDIDKNSFVYFSDAPSENYKPAKRVSIDEPSYHHTLSSNGNTTVITTINAIYLYDNKKVTIARRSLPKNKDGYAIGSIAVSPYYFLEHSQLLIAREEWRTSNSFIKVFEQPEQNLFSDAWLDKDVLWFEKGIGERQHIALTLPTLQISQLSSIPSHSAFKFKSDSVLRYQLPNNYLLVNSEGIYSDTARNVSINLAGRQLNSLLKKIDFAQADTVHQTLFAGNLSEGAFEHWDIANEKLIYRLWMISEKDYFIQVASGYFYATPQALPYVSAVINGQGVPSHLLNNSLNRPDKVLEAIYGSTARQYINFMKGYEKIAARKQNTSQPTHQSMLPVVQLQANQPATVNNASFSPGIFIKSNTSPVSNMMIHINNVLVWDTLFAKPVHQLSLNPTVTLVSGENQVVYTSKTVDNMESIPLTQRINYLPKRAASSKTYLITIGVSEYKDSTYNLTYAVKDGKDLLASFRNTTPASLLVTDSFFNEQATTKQLFDLKKKLMQTNVEDKVIISFSGHGLLDDSLNFYFATHDIDFANPSANGLSFSAIESILTGIPARKKLILLDACHSGQTDKSIFDTTVSNQNVVIQYNSNNEKTKSNIRKNITPTNNLMQALFSAGSSSSGAEIIAATGGNAFAFESPEWQNGVFTYAFLQALQSRNNADKNYNQMLSIKELKRFVYPMVQKLTNGNQKPIARYENPNYDWDVVNEINSWQ